MIVLGVNYFFHDSSACILRDGKLVCAIEEERLNRDKHTSRFPVEAIARCCQIAGIEPRDIDHVALSIKPQHNWHHKVRYALDHPEGAWGFVKYELSKIDRRQRGLYKWLFETYGATGPRPKLHYVEHHLSHVAGSFLASPYEEAALLGMDGAGEWATSFIGKGQGTTITCYGESFYPMSLGSFYEASTEFCGFKPNYDEGKTMGLAPYGDPTRFFDQMSKIATVDDEGRITIDLSYYTYQFHGAQRCGPKFHDTFGTPRKLDKNAPFESRHHDVAAATQRVLEERALTIARMLHERTRCRHLVIAGGVALNSVMNGRLVRETPYDDIYVMPGAGDNGTSIGAAYYVYHVLLGHPRKEVHDDPYVGTAYDDGAYRAALASRGLPVERQDRIERAAAQLLHEGKILGWFQGKMEFGPRALGNRSILANPTLPDMKAVLNAKVKHREAFRPFAPSCIAEAKGDFFETTVDAPFMLKVCDVIPSMRDKLPAITHVDGSARLQTVHRQTNARYHDLISELGKLNGVPVVLNTSFNVMGQPIVESPEQAVDCYLGTGIEALILGDYLVKKEA